MSALSKCPRCGTELVKIDKTKWFALFGCPHCGAICIFPPQDEGKEEVAEPPQEEQPEPEPIEEITPKTTTEDGALCPVCREGHLMKGACDKCGFDEAEGIECPGGLVRPFEKVEVCRGCLFYKRVYGNRPAFCKWDQWVDKGDEG